MEWLVSQFHTLPRLFRTAVPDRLGGNQSFGQQIPYESITLTIPSNTQYHLVIGVVCMFFYLIKVTMWLLHVFHPIFSVLLHIPLLAIWAYGIHIQTSPDTIDPARSNNGAPWYITKNCNIVDDKHVRSYCMQAKSSFAVSCVMLYAPSSLFSLPLHLQRSNAEFYCRAIYAFFLIITFYSLYPTSEARLSHSTRLAEKRAEKEKWASTPDGTNEMTAQEQWQHMWELQQLPRTPGTNGGVFFKSPMTPRTRAFGDLEGGNEYQQQEFKPHPSWVAHAHGQQTCAPGGSGWYGGSTADPGFVQVQQVSPAQEQGEYQYGYEGKGKETVGFAQ